MSLTNLQCNKCGRKYAIPSGFTPWNLQCHHCKTIIELNVGGHITYLNPDNGTRTSDPYQKKTAEEQKDTVVDVIGNFLGKFLLYSIPIACLATVILYFADSGKQDQNYTSSSPDQSYNSEPTPIRSEQIPIQESPPISTPVVDNHSMEESNQNILVYSGACTQYKKMLVESDKIKYETIGTGFGKVVINKSSKKFSFFFDGKLVFSQDQYLSYQDDDQGGEGFTFSGDFSAQRLSAEKSFKIVDEAGTFGSNGSFMGYEYEISNYKIN